eukprot:Sspe_Gene.75365::Locus_47092_Transcript_1_1_Confidence_1.000_Length_809::g.75365::m.75365
MPEVESYYVKQVEYNGYPVSIVCQTENGPCPFISISNILLLQRKIHIHPDHASVTASELLNLVSNYLVEMYQSTTDLNAQYTLDEAIQQMPQLQEGLEVNIKFQGPTAYEIRSPIFDVFRMRMVHGWVISPDHPAADVVRGKSYDSLLELIIHKGEIQAEAERKKKLADEGTDVEPEDPETVAKNQKVTEDASKAETFLKESANQLTYAGLFDLMTTVSEGELCIFFRNNHFSTITKRDGSLFTLVTD